MKTKRGRPPIDPALKASEMVPVRMTTTERDEYRRAAERAGVSLSEWIRGCLSRAVKRSAKGS
jgi:predicted HicB family RNase H-like nuclease